MIRYNNVILLEVKSLVPPRVFRSPPYELESKVPALKPNILANKSTMNEVKNRYT